MKMSINKVSQVKCQSYTTEPLIIYNAPVLFGHGLVWRSVLLLLLSVAENGSEAEDTENQAANSDTDNEEQQASDLVKQVMSKSQGHDYRYLILNCYNLRHLLGPTEIW